MPRMNSIRGEMENGDRNTRDIQSTPSFIMFWTIAFSKSVNNRRAPIIRATPKISCFCPRFAILIHWRTDLRAKLVLKFSKDSSKMLILSIPIKCVFESLHNKDIKQLYFSQFWGQNIFGSLFGYENRRN